MLRTVPYQLTPTRHCCGSCQSPLPGRYQLYINTIPFMKHIHTTMISSPPYITTPLTGPLLNHVCYYGTPAHVYHKYLTSQLPTTQINQPLYTTTEHLNIHTVSVQVQCQKETSDLPLKHPPSKQITSSSASICLSPKSHTFNSIIQPKIWYHNINQPLHLTLFMQKLGCIGSNILARLYWWRSPHNKCLFKIHMIFCNM